MAVPGSRRFKEWLSLSPDPLLLFLDEDVATVARSPTLEVSGTEG